MTGIRTPGVERIQDAPATASATFGPTLCTALSMWKRSRSSSLAKP